MKSGERKCVRCGCTDSRACPGGCSWVSLDPPICSACAASGDGADPRDSQPHRFAEALP